MQNNFQPINHLEIMKVLESDHCLPFMKNCLRDFRHQDHKPGYKLYKKKKIKFKLQFRNNFNEYICHLYFPPNNNVNI